MSCSTRFRFKEKAIQLTLFGEMNMIDRSETARAMAKAIAYKQCGKDAEAAQWARELVRLLQCAEILAK